MSEFTYTPFEQQFTQFLMNENKTPEDLELSSIVLRLLRDMRLGHTCTKMSDTERLMLLTQMIVSDAADPRRPLVVAGNRLYLQRYFIYEKMAAQSIFQRLKQADNSSIESLITPNDMLDMYQKLAIYVAGSKRFSIITGGPGTGKTTSILYVIMAELRKNPTLDIVLCAPTGKAQARMKQSIIKSINREKSCDTALKERILSIPSLTIHRLLGVRAHSTQFKHHSQNPLKAKMIIVDECSMISLGLMAKLLDAIALDAKVVLLGDKNQLPSVEAGSLFSDICESGQANRVDLRTSIFLHDAWGIDICEKTDSLPLTTHIVELQYNHRFKSDQHIGVFAKMIKNLYEGHDINVCANRIATADFENEFKTMPEREFESMLSKLIYEPICSVQGDLYTFMQLKRWSHDGDFLYLSKALELTDSFKILCATRDGAYGVNQVNEYMKKELGFKQEFQCGDPIMISENRVDLDLYNGDTGILWHDKEGKLKAFFRGDKDDEFRSFVLAQLPKFEINFAMTIHKSQGSGFENVMTLLPPSEGLCRELLYTAITRAEKRFYLFAQRSTIQSALQKRTDRHSGFSAHF